MSAVLRKSEILRIAREDGMVTVERLAELFDVTVQTIRRDLAELAEAGKLERVHGGAVAPSGVANIGYLERRALNPEAKARIAEACAREIPEKASVFLNIGTTTEAVARALLRHRALLAVTNNINIANILAENEECEVVVAGGRLRRADGGLVGDLTTEAIARFKPDIAVIGCSALDPEGDILDYDIAEVGASRAILRQARRVFLVADRSKFERTAPARIGALGDVDTLFTDAPLEPELAARCARWGTRVVVA